GRGLTLSRCRALKQAGLKAVGVSVDGPPLAHDRLRASLGSYLAAMTALENAREAGLLTTANTQVNRLNKDHLVETADALRGRGVAVWRAQLTVPMGRAADHPDWILEPYMVTEVIDTLAAIQRGALERARAEGTALSRAFHVRLGNNLGYFGPHEQMLRSRPGGADTHWHGCQAGVYTMGIESDGKVKGCPSLPSAPYTGGNVRDLSLAEIWEHTEELRFARDRTTDELWGRCRACYYAETCRGGCSFTAHCTVGRRGNNPFCYYRAARLRSEGRREVLRLRERPPGEPYDFGRFEIVEEALPAVELAGSEQRDASPSPSGVG
ncbi:MAG: SPASM domain-containing protein, partial [Myxococcales bacterium FL481]